MFSKLATTTLTNVARRRAINIAQNGSKLNAPFRALSDVAASAPKQPVDIPPSVGKQWGQGKPYRHCHPHRGRVAGKVLAFGLVGYGGYWYGSKYGEPNAHKDCSWRTAKEASEGKDISESKPQNAEA